MAGARTVRQREGGTVIAPVRPPAPTDAACAEAWTWIAQIASELCLIVAAYGGTMSLAMPEDQRAAGIRERVLLAHVRGEVEP